MCKVYVGSFNSEAPVREDVNPYARSLFEAEQKQLLADLYEIPQRSCDRKINGGALGWGSGGGMGACISGRVEAAAEGKSP